MNNYDPIKFTHRFVFGTDPNSSTNPLSIYNDYNDHIRPKGSIPPAFEFDMLDYLTHGAGRYATPATFPLVDQFFAASTVLPANNTYFGTAQIREALGFGDPDRKAEFEEATEVAIWQYGTDIHTFDFPERAYIFGTTGFTLDLTNATFIVGSNGEKSITGLRVKANPDNFDFVGGAKLLSDVAKRVLTPVYDPYGLGRENVPIKYTTSTDGREYGTLDNPYGNFAYTSDNIIAALDTSIAGTASGAAKLLLGIATLFPLGAVLSSSYLININSDQFLRYKRGNAKVIYGTFGNDDLNPGDREIDIVDPQLTLSAFSSNLIVGGAGNDTITSFFLGDELLGGDGNDFLIGGNGDDTLNGGKGNDSLNGGTGEDDVVIFSDDFENYDYAISLDKTTNTFGHNRGTQTDGVDTVKNSEWGQFGGNSNPNLSGPPRLIPLPLEDGVKDLKAVKGINTPSTPISNDPPTPPYVTLSAPVAMLDKNIDYTLNISPYKPDTQYNILYIIDTSLGVSESELTQAKNAYTNLTNYFINNGLADNINFGVVSYNTQAAIKLDSQGDRNLTATEALAAIDSLYLNSNPVVGTDYDLGLWEGFNFLSTSPLRPSFPTNPDGTTSISYFFSEGVNTSDRPLYSNGEILVAKEFQSDQKSVKQLAESFV